MPGAPSAGWTLGSQQLVMPELLSECSASGGKGLSCTPKMLMLLSMTRRMKTSGTAVSQLSAPASEEVEM